MAMNDLSIRKTDEGHFVLVHIDKTRKVESERHRSSDLDEIVERLLDGHKKSGIRGKPSRDYGPLMKAMRDLCEKFPQQDHESFPSHWTDPLELYGCISEELTRHDANLEHERRELSDLVFERGPEWVWKNRVRLVAEKVSSLSSEDWQKVQTEVS